MPNKVSGFGVHTLRSPGACRLCCHTLLSSRRSRLFARTQRWTLAALPSSHSAWLWDWGQEKPQWAVKVNIRHTTGTRQCQGTAAVPVFSGSLRFYYLSFSSLGFFDRILLCFFFFPPIPLKKGTEVLWARTARRKIPLLKGISALTQVEEAAWPSSEL